MSYLLDGNKPILQKVCTFTKQRLPFPRDPSENEENSKDLQTGKVRCAVQIVGRALIYVIVQPVRIKVVGMGPPHQKRLDGAVVVLIIVFWNLDLHSLAQIPFVLIDIRIL